ncbi:unnamed protein product [Brassica oleracea]|uniref:(rape) hypothetical protein n=1 Tax=Brassica napus TaxID=3708 RepID=A0A816K7D9_BRANA|nr:unnamed protein product [Brassica napus]
MRRQGRVLLGRSGRRRRDREANQSTGYCVHNLERERNTRKHGDKPRSTVTMYKIIDRLLRNRLLSSMNELRDGRYQDSFQQ